MKLNLFAAVLIHLWLAGWLLAMARAAWKSRLPVPAHDPVATPAPGIAGR